MLTAHHGLLSHPISHVSDDAKRSMLLHGTSGLNGMPLFGQIAFNNTACTIQNGPTRSPAVLQKIATKSGWLLKRNAQHVWQSRWCCVVPHLFLYEFEGHPKLAPPTDQSAPAGILDLECYTTVLRNADHNNDLVLELTGDESINPDLPRVNFCALTEKEGVEWTQAILNHRHSSLVDAKEAYREVLDGSTQQLQVMHEELDSAHRKEKSKNGELYSVRSQLEATRRLCWNAILSTLEQDSYNTLIPAKKAYREELERTMQSPEEQEPQHQQQQPQDMGILDAVQGLCNYTQDLEKICNQQGAEILELKRELETKQEAEDAKEAELEAIMERFQQNMKEQQRQWIEQIETLQERYIEFQTEHTIVVKDLAAQRMEHAMHRSASNAKIAELQAHKKILKKEVLSLRQEVLSVESEQDKSESLLLRGLQDGSLRNHSFLDRREEKKEEASSALACGLFQ
jgi:hypothetical protein